METEFIDYKFKDHFGGSVPLYLPWGLLLDYMMARVTNIMPTCTRTWSMDTMQHFIVFLYNKRTKKEQYHHVLHKDLLPTWGRWKEELPSIAAWMQGNNK
jgi:hypothetical protein